MKILKKCGGETEKTFPMKVTCEFCSSELEIEESDLHEGYMGSMYIVCPVCGKNSYVDDIDTPPITADTIKFPEHFHYFGDGVDINNEEIQEWIKKAIKWFRENPENFSYSTGTGNTRIHVENFSGDEAYCVVVSKDFYETEIPYEKADYCAQDNYDWNWKNKGIKIIYKDKEGE